VSAYTPEQRTRRISDAERFEVVADTLKPLTKSPDARLAKKARELEEQARSIAEGLRAAVLLDDARGAA
jgi:hypothetical protein